MPNTDDDTSLDTVHDEMRATFESQVERLQEIDGKAIEILKANLLLIGVFVTGLSILAQAEIDVGAFANIFTVFAGALLLCSTALAGVTYTSSNIRGGLDSQALERVRSEGYTEDEFADALAESYGRWIDYNAEVTAVNDVLITVTVLLVIDAFIYLVVGIVVAAVAPPLAVSVAGFVVLTVVLGWLTRLVYSMDHINTEGGRPPFDGVRVSKGASREQALSALVRMLQKTEETEDEDK